jgi:hypothetical protein
MNEETVKGDKDETARESSGSPVDQTKPPPLLSKMFPKESSVKSLIDIAGTDYPLKLLLKG